MALLDKFTQFIQSPGATGLAAGLLQGSAPSMTQPSSFGSAFGLGLSNMQRAQEEALKRQLAEKYFGLDQGKLGLAQQELGIKKGAFDIEKYKAQREAQQANDTRVALGLDPLPMPNIGGGVVGVPDLPAAVDNVIGQAMGESPNPEQNIPNTQRQAAYLVTDPRVNGGAETYVPSHDEAGNFLDKEQAIQQATQKPEKSVSAINSGTASNLGEPIDTEAAMQKPIAGKGLLGDLSPQQMQDAKRAYMLGGNAALLKVLTPEKEKKTKEEKLLEKGLPTTTTISQNQQSIKSIDKLIPSLKEVIEMDIPKQGFPIPFIEGKYSYFQPEKQAKYLAKISAAVDTYVKAFNLPNTNESLHLAENILTRAPFESEAAYKDRLNDEIEKLIEARSYLSSNTPMAGAASEVNYSKPSSKGKNDPLGIR